MNLVTIAVFANAFNAHVLQGRMKAEGIECYIQDEHTIQTNPFYTNAIGGIKLQVKDTDVQQSVLLLHSLGYRTVFDTPPIVEKKPPHILIRFFKFLIATVAVLGWLYFTQFGPHLP